MSGPGPGGFRPPGIQKAYRRRRTPAWLLSAGLLTFLSSFSLEHLHARSLQSVPAPGGQGPLPRRCRRSARTGLAVAPRLRAPDRGSAPGAALERHLSGELAPACPSFPVAAAAGHDRGPAQRQLRRAAGRDGARSRPPDLPQRARCWSCFRSGRGSSAKGM